MKMSRLSVKGFRSLKDAVWEPGNLNVLLGPNGSGKSNLLRLFQMVAAAANGRLSEYVRRAGGMGAILWDGRVEEVAIELTTTLPSEGSTPAPTCDPKGLQYNATLARLGPSASFRFAREELLLRDVFSALLVITERGGHHDRTPFQLLRRQGAKATALDAEGRSIPAAVDFAKDEESVLPQMANPLLAHSWLIQFHTYLSGWAVYHDIDMSPRSEIRAPVVTRHEKRVAPDGQNLANVLQTLYSTERDFRERLDAAMRAGFGDVFEGLQFVPVADQRIQLSIQWAGLRRPTAAPELSDGTLRFLLLLAILLDPAPAPFIAIDEPETGLHPSMMSVIAECAVEASLQTQLVLTTHSPQFLDAFKEERPKTTIAKWTDGETKLVVLEGERLENWLEAYSLGELFRSGELESVE